MPDVIRRGVRLRYLILAVACVPIWLVTYNPADQADWHFFQAGADAVSGTSGLHVYADMPYLQFGPVALLVALLCQGLGPADGWALLSVIDIVLGVFALFLLERAATAIGADRREAIERCALIGGVFFLLAWASPGVSQGHPDDVLALVMIAGAVWSAATNRWWLCALLVGLSSAAKPWALLCLPLALATRGRRVHGLLLAVAAAGIPWVPFVIADPRTTRVGDFHLPVGPFSTLHYLGMAVGEQPSWPRYVQLALALLLGGLAVRRGRWFLVPLIAFAVRINADPASIDYYAAGPVFGALVWDLVSPAALPGIRTAAAWLMLLYLPTDVGALGVGGSVYDAVVVTLRLLVLVAALAPLALRARAGPSAESPELC